MNNKILVALTLDRGGGLWKGTTREQNYVLSTDGICMSIPATYDKHPFKVLVYEEEIQVLPISERSK